VKSVIVELQTTNKRVDFDIDKLAKAQKTAINMKLPFAVIFCFEKFAGWSQNDFINLYHDLVSLESKLSPYNIKLVVMVGNKGEKLPKLYSHIEPQIELLQEPATLKKHPYDWIGVWFSVEYLRSRFEQEIGYNLDQ